MPGTAVRNCTMKREKDKEIYILSNIYRIHALAGRILDREGRPAALPFDGFEKTDPVLCSPHLFGELAGWDAGYAEGEYRVCDDGGYWYYVFRSPGYYVIWGPVVFEEHSGYEKRLYGKRHGVQGDMCAVPLADIGKLEDTVLFAHGLLSGQYGKNVAIAHGKAAERIQEELLPQFAGAAGLHPGYFSRIFAGQMGMTVMEYVMQEKVRVSCNLLKYSNQPIAVIAEYMNLSPQSYFTRVFKKVMGETPARYRKTHADKNFLES